LKLLIWALNTSRIPARWLNPDDNTAKGRT
jgi:hypothetical protein